MEEQLAHRMADPTCSNQAIPTLDDALTKLGQALCQIFAEEKVGEREAL